MSKRPKIQALNNEAAKLINKAHRYWSSTEGRTVRSFKRAGNNFGRVTENNKNLYPYIRGTPTVTFTSDAQIWSFLKQFGHPNNPRFVRNGIIPKHRKLYILPAILFAGGPRSLVNASYYPGSPPRTSTRLALVNKGLMNRYMTERSLRQPNIPAGTSLKQVRSFIRAANKLTTILNTMRRKKASNVALTASLREGLRRRRIYREGLNAVRKKYPSSRNT
jgi:hypothetical protein